MTVKVADDVRLLEPLPSRKLPGMPPEPRQKTQVSDPTGRTVATNVRRIREVRGLSTYELASRLEAAGRPIAASAISKIERAERRVDVGDLMTLAHALGVSPVTLLLPVDARGTAEVTGVGEVDGRAAWHWAWCESPLSLPQNEHEAERAYTEFMLYSRPIGLFTSQGDDRIPGFVREPRTRGADGPSVD
ncbi:helix-turn-helix domain-containing protein [Streptomyces fungicidicus]|uniref:helix-turn-helix domain-containing protein n=1 Tax=Streptomyces fungicidicus TaxID=68203 RepID=UPI0036C534D3